MRTSSLLLSLLGISLFAQIAPVAQTKSNDMVPASDSSGAIMLPAARLKLDVTYPGGKKKDRCELTVVYDPKIGYFLWHISESNPSVADDAGHRLKLLKTQRVVAFADAQGLVEFTFGDGLFAKVWRGRADSLDDAISASTAAIRQRIGTFEGLGFHHDYKLIPVFGGLRGFDAKVPSGHKPISKEFRCEPYNAFCPSTNNTIASVSKQGSNFRLVLRNRFDVEVILDQNLDLVSTRQLTEPKKQSDPPGMLK